MIDGDSAATIGVAVVVVDTKCGLHSPDDCDDCAYSAEIAPARLCVGVRDLRDMRNAGQNGNVGVVGSSSAAAYL